MNTRRTSAIGVAALAMGLTLPTVPAHAAPTPAATPTAAPQYFVVAQGRVTAASLNVRSRATTSSPRVATLRRGAWVTPVCSTVGQSVAGNRTWFWDGDPQGGGWVSAHYVHMLRGSVPKCSAFPGLHLMNASMNDASQVNRQLAGTSASFRKHIAAEITALRRNAPKSCVRVDVTGWWGNDQAIGGVGDCGGAVTVWSLKGTRWNETSWNGSVSCSTLRTAGARHAIPGNTGITCYVKSGGQWVEKQYTPAG